MEGFEYNGVKAGRTIAAGGCLVSTGTRGSDSLIVVVLGSTIPRSGLKTEERIVSGRYLDTRNLFRWAWRRRGH